MRGDLRPRCLPVQKIVDRLAVDAHVGVVDVSQQAHDGGALRPQVAAKLELHVLGVGEREVSLELDAVGDRGHGGFGKAHAPVAVFEVGDQAPGVAAGIGGVVVGAIVVDGPVEELGVAVTTNGVQIEEIRHAELASAQLQPPRRHFRGQRERRALGFHLLPAERDDLMQHDARQVRRAPESRVAHHVQVGKARQAECVAQAVPAGALHVKQEVGRAR